MVSYLPSYFPGTLKLSWYIPSAFVIAQDYTKQSSLCLFPSFLKHTFSVAWVESYDCE
jgi:hypothetical protein